MTGTEDRAIDWALARRVAVAISGADQFSASYHRSVMEREFAAIVPRAQELVSAETLWDDGGDLANAVVVDRAGWIDANISSFRRLLRPLTTAISSRVGGLGTFVGSRVAAVELGTMLGWMSRRVLGQYDLLILDDESIESGADTSGPSDAVYFVGPNLFDLERTHGFPPEEFRMWVALHELTHRSQFRSNPHLKAHFLSMVETMIDGAQPDVQQAFVALGRIAEAVSRGKNPLADGIAPLFVSREQRGVLDQIGGMMSLLEGHGDVVMDRAGLDAVPSASRFARTLRARRESGGTQKVLMQLLGMEAKLRQYADGEDFIAAIEQAAGPRAIYRAFERVENLPTMDEIREPSLWTRRVLSTD